ncbi:polysaccharide deacetylase family protein [Patulibacter defluvii]|uniref:polysaccharide deacetylase family protein n=1 Tax=Patulibacter defluvii TaxID=3095358 RepID=UPI002A760C69|nr:polysaccharide deacetylase family protein [Patulibacter sp. DM4]
MRLVHPRRALAPALDRAGLLPALLRRGRGWRGVLVLAYHRVVEAPGPRAFRGVWSTDPAGFAAQLDVLAEHCEVVPIEDVPRYHGVRGRRVAITVDDCYVDSYAVMFPALRARGMPAAFFLPSGIIDRRVVAFWDQVAWLGGGLPEDERLPEDELVAAYGALRHDQQAGFLDDLAARSRREPLTPAMVDDDWMTWDMAREMAAAGMTIGGHTDSHPILSRLPVAEQRREIALGVERIADELGERPTTFAYPVGGPAAFGPETAAIVRELGLVGYSIYGRPAGGGAWDPANARRVAIDGDATNVRAIVGLPTVFAVPWPPPALVRRSASTRRTPA